MRDQIERLAAGDGIAAIAHWAAATPHRSAAAFIDGRGRIVERLTFAELDAAARAMAARLEALAAPGERVIIAEAPGLEFLRFFLGCLYSGLIAVPVALPRRAESDETDRFLHIAADCECRLILSSPEVAARLAQIGPLKPLLERHWRDLSLGDAPVDSSLGHFRPQEGDVAFLQYTSGSTGAPKGVRVTHRNIAHNCERIRERCRLDTDSKALIWLPHFHDLGLIGGILTPLLAGFSTTLMAPISFLKRPLDWLRLIGEGGFTISGGPDFAYRLCVERYDPDRLAGLDLSAWRCAFNCAEPVMAETVSRFAVLYRVHGFDPEATYPCYGMAESTLTIASHAGPRPVRLYGANAERLEADALAEPAGPGDRRRDLVSVGQAAPDQIIAIVDPKSGKSLPDRRVGEIWSSDPSIADGYWRRPEESARTFGAVLAEHGERRFLRTGDLGFLDQGELYVTGRLKDLVIIDGRNLHPEDIELTVKAAAGIGAVLAAAAFAVPRPGHGEELTILVERDRRAGEEQEARLRVRSALAQRHEIGVVDIRFVPSGSIPRTTSGKVRRAEARALFLAGTFEGTQQCRT